jgi:hypothetical protein
VRRALVSHVADRGRGAPMVLERMREVGAYDLLDTIVNKTLVVAKFGSSISSIVYDTPATAVTIGVTTSVGSVRTFRMGVKT